MLDKRVIEAKQAISEAMFSVIRHQQRIEAAVMLCEVWRTENANARLRSESDECATAAATQRERGLSHWTRQLPCLLCGDNTSVEAIHVRYSDLRADKPRAE